MQVQDARAGQIRDTTEPGDRRNKRMRACIYEDIIGGYLFG